MCFEGAQVHLESPSEVFGKFGGIQGPAAPREGGKEGGKVALTNELFVLW